MLAHCRAAAARRSLAMLLLALLLHGTATAATAPPLAQLSDAAIGSKALWLVEGGQEMSLAQARDAAEQGHFRDLGREVPSMAPASPPIWMQLRVRNDASGPQAAHLVVRSLWLDQIDVYTVHEGQPPTHWRGGEMVPGAQGLEPALGVVVPVVLAPGETALFARFSTPETMLLPLYLMDDERLRLATRTAHYVYGLLYGFVLALLVYNATVGMALRESSYLHYAMYLLSMLGANLVINGFGLAWWWPQAPDLQNVALPSLMLAKGLCGLLFTCHLFQLARNAPRVCQGLCVAGLLAAAAVAAAIHYGADAWALTLARDGMLAASLAMLLVGAWHLRRSASSAPLFVLGVAFGLSGTLVTLLTLRGVIDMTPLRYHAVGIGHVLEALLLALALVSRMRQTRQAHRQAEHLAMRDALTGLLNRRGFMEMSRKTWEETDAHRPLSLLMLDIDHFKRVNDTHGHEVGDQVLVALAQLLTHHCREGDEVGRWGGEEFVVLLRGATLQQAGLLADRLRLAVEGMSIPAPHSALTVTISLGAAQRVDHAGLYELVNEADHQLYAAKRGGRNRVATALSAA